MDLSQDTIFKVLTIEEKYAYGMGICYLSSIISERSEQVKIFFEKECAMGYSPYFVSTGQKAENGKKYNT